MTVKHFQWLINQVKDIVKVEIGILDDNGYVVASTNSSSHGKKDVFFEQFTAKHEDFVECGENIYHIQSSNGKIDMITYICSMDESDKRLLAMFSINALSIKQAYDEKHDKFNFIKNILLDNVLPGDIPLRFRELGISNNVERIVYIIKNEKNLDFSIYEALQTMFPDRQKDFVVSMDEENTVVVKELNSDYYTRNGTRFANRIINSIKEEHDIKVTIGIGTVVNRIKDIGASFKEAQLALFVGEIFQDDKSILNYSTLGIGRLIYQLPTTLCKLFLKEVFKDSYQEILQEEMAETVESFFKNHLNVSETARKLFIHRNTLVYRLDKIQKVTDLDLRTFDDAIVFKVAMMVKKYLNNADISVY